MRQRNRERERVCVSLCLSVCLSLCMLVCACGRETDRQTDKQRQTETQTDHVHCVNKTTRHVLFCLFSFFVRLCFFQMVVFSLPLQVLAQALSVSLYCSVTCMETVYLSLPASPARVWRLFICHCQPRRHCRLDPCQVTHHCRS